jgi:hypothetical protein
MRDISTAPKDGTNIGLNLRKGDNFAGMYSGKYWGWVALYEIACPLIRGDNQFAGWEPISAAQLRQIRAGLLIRPARRRTKQINVVVIPQRIPVEARAMAIRITDRIVRAKKPRRKK